MRKKSNRTFGENKPNSKPILKTEDSLSGVTLAKTERQQWKK